MELYWAGTVEHMPVADMNIGFAVEKQRHLPIEILQHNWGDEMLRAVRDCPAYG